jgi:DNA polymerase III delta prime subunit
MARNAISEGRRDFYCEHLDDETTETAARAAAAESQKLEWEKEWSTIILQTCRQQLRSASSILQKVGP